MSTQGEVRNRRVPGDSSSAKGLPLLPIHIRLGGCLRRRARRLVYGWWAWEMLAATVSLVAAFALVAVLAQADNHESQAWSVGDTQLTLNTIVAAIGTVQRAALLLAVTGALNQHMWNWFASKRGAHEPPSRPFEDLVTFSEGASNLFCCLRLLWRTKGRYIVSIGALIVILAIGFDAFLQQLIVVQNQPQQGPLAASSLRPDQVLPQVLGLREQWAEIAQGSEKSPQTPYKLTSRLDDEGSAAPSASCPTGECFWPETPTVAICSRCETMGTRRTVTSNSTCERIITYTLDKKFLFNQSITYATCGGANFAAWELVSLMPFNGVNTPNTVANVLIHGSPVTAKTDSLDDITCEAYWCQYYACVKGYTAAYTQGKLRRSPPKELANRTHIALDSNGDKYLRFDDLPSPLNESSSALFDVPYGLFSFLSMPFSGWRMNQYISGVAGYAAAGGSGIAPNDTASHDPISDLDTRFLAPNFWAASSSLANLTVYAESVAESFTNWMRTSYVNTGPSDARYAPMITTQVPTVSVRWVWLTFPLAVQVGGLAFLALTVHATSRRNVRPWKGDRVPLLLARLDDSIRQRASGGLANRTGLDDRLARMRIRLHFDGENDISFRKA